jgi:hypothetical protein
MLKNLCQYLSTDTDDSHSSSIKEEKPFVSSHRQLLRADLLKRRQRSRRKWQTHRAPLWRGAEQNESVDKSAETQKNLHADISKMNLTE